MIGQLMRCSALLLLFCAASSLAVESLNITRMTWSYTPVSGDPGSNLTELTVCTGTPDLLANGGDIIRLVVGTTVPSEKPFEGSLGDPSSCAQFSEGGDLPLPSAEATLYKLTVSDRATEEELSSGSVSFAYPVTDSEIIDCGGTMIGRLTLNGDDPGPSNCFQGSGSSTTLCYVNVDPSDTNTVCVTGLDANSTVEVCEANIPGPVVAVADVTVKYISYGDMVANLDVSYEGSEPGDLTELLSRQADGDGSTIVHSCTGDICILDPFSPSISKYELCGMFTENNAVTHVGNATFQDLKLTIDSTSPTVDFHFYNVESTSYNVYEDPEDLGTLGEATFTLDCSRIDAGSYCNGFTLTDGTSPATIAVSFTGGTNAVATSIVYGSQEPGRAVVSRAAGDTKDAADLRVEPLW